MFKNFIDENRKTSNEIDENRWKLPKVKLPIQTHIFTVQKQNKTTTTRRKTYSHQQS